MKLKKKYYCINSSSSDVYILFWLICLVSVPTFSSSNPHYNPIFGSFDLVSSPVWWKAVTNDCLCSGDKADCFNLLLALLSAGYLAKLSGIRVGQSIVSERQT